MHGHYPQLSAYMLIAFLSPAISRKFVERPFGLNVNLCSSSFARFDGGESAEAAAERARLSLETLAAGGGQDRTVVAVTHGDFLHSLLGEALARDPDAVVSTAPKIANCGISVVDVHAGSGRTSVKVLNSVAHLEKAPS